MTNKADLRDSARTRTGYVREAIIVNYASIQKSLRPERGKKANRWFKPSDISPYVPTFLTKIDRELRKLAMQGFLEVKIIRSSYLPNVYRVNTDSWNFEQYTKRIEAMGMLEFE